MRFEHLTQSHIARIREHPFVQKCRDGSITRQELDLYLAQQAKYSSYFTRYLCALIANLQHNDDVMALAANLAEELGFDADVGEPHARIYARMLDDLGIHHESIPILPATEQLISTALHYCKQRNPAYGLGALCLGAEAIVAPLYSDIINGFIANGINLDRLTFFKIHVECDDGHAETMQHILARIYTERPQDVALALEGAEAMIDARMGFFTDILKGVVATCH